LGALAVTRAVLPTMRAKRTGAIAFMGSIGGWDSGANYGLYSAVKFALAGISLSLREEVKSFGIKVTIIEPGYFRTNFLSSGGGHKVTAKKVIEELGPVTEPAKQMLTQYHHQQPGDPVKGAQLIVDALRGTGPCAGKTLPRRLLLGSDAVAFVEGVLQKEKEELEEWREISVTTDIAQ
jgi:NAD(P)-dependent dehydrogenase (short-subunit alcohol dehydrogenase family)